MTSPITQIAIECPNCRNKFQTYYRASMNLELDDFSPDYVEKMSTAICPKCRKKIPLDTLLVDKDRTFKMTPTLADQLNKLAGIGFQLVGEWLAENGEIRLKIDQHADKTNILYAFVSEGEVLYIGKTTQSLKTRLYGYQNPGPTQSTNLKGRKELLELLKGGKKIEVYARPDDGLMRIGDFPLNLAAALEDSIVALLQPRWNKMGKMKPKA